MKQRITITRETTVTRTIRTMTPHPMLAKAGELLGEISVLQAAAYLALKNVELAEADLDEALRMVRACRSFIETPATPEAHQEGTPCSSQNGTTR